MTTPTEKLNAITTAIAAGKTIYVCSRYVHTKINAKTIAKFEAAGRKLFIATEDHLLMSAGRRYDSINGCVIKVA